MVEKELQEFELTLGEHRLSSLVHQEPPLWIEPETLELPDPLIPKIEPVVVAVHLLLNERNVHLGRLSRHGLKLGQLPLDPFQETEFEADQVVIDAHPVARVFPVLSFDVLSLEWSTSGLSHRLCDHRHQL